MAHWDINNGEYVTLSAVLSNEKKRSVNVESGYKITATVTLTKGDEANAVAHWDSTNQASRVSIDGNDLTVYLLTSAESENAAAGNYYYDVWIKNTSTLEQDVISNGTINIVDSVTDVK